MTEEEQKISMQDATDKASDAQQGTPQEDPYAGITLDDTSKETQRPGGRLAHS
jgi:hypothetical protein